MGFGILDNTRLLNYNPLIKKKKKKKYETIQCTAPFSDDYVVFFFLTTEFSQLIL